MKSILIKNQIISDTSLFCLLFIFLISCSSESKQNQSITGPQPEIVELQERKLSQGGELEKKLEAADLVNIAEVIPGIRVELMYSTENNFMGKNMYGDLTNAYLQADVAEKLKKAERLLQLKDSTLTLLVYDAVRPLHIQQLMWDSLDIPNAEKRNFLSDPAIGSLHNYGAAVDLTIATIEGTPLDMGTPYDFIGHLAYPTLEDQLLKEGKLTAEQIANRKLLRSVMFQSGFTGIESEWWHFNSCTREEARIRYKVIE